MINYFTQLTTNFCCGKNWTDTRRLWIVEVTAFCRVSPHALLPLKKTCPELVEGEIQRDLRHLSGWADLKSPSIPLFKGGSARLQAH